MVCYSPIDAWRNSKDSTDKKLIFQYNPKLCDTPFPQLKVSCGQCIGCRLEYSRQWAVRGCAEAHSWENNCFITLTYSPEKIPKNSSLVLRDFQKFMKRLRRRCVGVQEIEHPKTGEMVKPIRVYYCGEYGDENQRPHYHAILFNFDFPDKIKYKVNNGYTLYTSKILDDLWSDSVDGASLGFASVGECNFDTIAYVARYMLKKVKGSAKDELITKTFYTPQGSINVDLLPYQRFNSITGEVVDVLPEFSNCSRAWGIGKQYFDKYNAEIYVTDTVVYKGRECPPPRYFDSLLKNNDYEKYEEIKIARTDNAKKYLDNNTQARLNVRKRVKESQIKTLKREV